MLKTECYFFSMQVHSLFKKSSKNFCELGILCNLVSTPYQIRLPYIELKPICLKPQPYRNKSSLFYFGKHQQRNLRVKAYIADYRFT